MSTWMIALVTLCYAATCVDQAAKRNYPMAIMWFGYAVANVGILRMLK